LSSIQVVPFQQDADAKIHIDNTQFNNQENLNEKAVVKRNPCLEIDPA